MKQMTAIVSAIFVLILSFLLDKIIGNFIYDELQTNRWMFIVFAYTLTFLAIELNLKIFNKSYQWFWQSLSTRNRLFWAILVFSLIFCPAFAAYLNFRPEFVPIAMIASSILIGILVSKLGTKEIKLYFSLLLSRND